ncbi:DUF512 domain-containing protein [Chthonomonas calidirosea]|uniref:DUF512 domain-containing protein n=1 Tax=Chthonomonas calidirosea TaxID=454171 RepID=UPI0006EC4C18|nr:DUF512 domain-containing protein [Chthonomonas calidirosea]CEK13916.1 Fe-S oxidoreductase [Chthonomonas calidirosea]
MSEIFVKNLNALVVSQVVPHSPAAQVGIRPGDLLKRINGKQILDILDYRFYAAEEQLRLTIQRSEHELEFELYKEPEEDLGLEFEHELGDKVHTCKNRCVFCFIHQQPKGMRRSLYLMDDDFRLSFMHGNYVTLTNITTQEWERILEQRLSPLYVSVHATDPILRGRLLGRKEPAPILPQLRMLADNRIDVHAQIVLCPDLNDGPALDQTLVELAAEHRAITGKRAGVCSVAIVPVGLTRFRTKLTPLRCADRDYARALIAQVQRHTRRFRKMLGTRFAWLGDEWYYVAQYPYPGRAHYEEFPQLEDGIGTMRLFLEELRRIAPRLPRKAPYPVSATLVTAELPAAQIQQLAALFNRIEGIELNVCVVQNHFFGGNIHIAGLLTAQDILHHLAQYPDCRQTVFIPSICLRDNTLFLDDLTVAQARELSGLDLQIVGNSPRALASALGLLPSYSASPKTQGSAWVVNEHLAEHQLDAQTS